MQEQLVNELIIAGKMDPAKLFSDPVGMDDILKGIRAKLDEFIPDVSTDTSRKEIASMARKVSRSKTFLDDIRKKKIETAKAEIDKANGIWKPARETLDRWRDETRSPLGEWEAEEALREEEEAAREKEIIQGRIDALFEYGVTMPFLEVAAMTEDEFAPVILKARTDYATEQARLAKEAEAEKERLETERLEREAEKKRIADEDRKLEIKKKIQALHEVYVTPEMTAADIEELTRNYKTEMLPGDEFEEFQFEAMRAYDNKITALLGMHGDKVDQEERDAAQKAAQDKINADRRATEKQKNKNKVDALLNTGLRFNGSEFFYEDILTTHHVEVMAMPDEVFHAYVGNMKSQVESRKKKSAEQEKKDREESERRAKIKAEQDAKDKAERESQERIAKAEAEKKEAERQEDLKPDKQKMIEYAELLMSTIEPAVASQEAQEFMVNATNRLSRWFDWFKEECDKL